MWSPPLIGRHDVEGREYPGPEVGGAVCPSAARAAGMGVGFRKAVEVGRVGGVLMEVVSLGHDPEQRQPRPGSDSGRFLSS